MGSSKGWRVPAAESRERGGAAETDASCHSDLDGEETHMGKEQDVNEATEGAHAPSVASFTSCSFQVLLIPTSRAGSETTSSTCPAADWRCLRVPIDAIMVKSAQQRWCSTAEQNLDAGSH